MHVVDCRLHAAKDGDYMFCLDNTFSRFSSKQVFFEFMTEHDDDDDGDPLKVTALLDDLSHYDMQLDDFRVSFRSESKSAFI